MLEQKNFAGNSMKTVRRVAKNIGVLLASQVVGYLLGFFYVMYAARYLGVKGFGILSFALAFASVFGVLADLGLQQFTIREVARDKSLAGKYLANISVIKIILVIVTFGLIVLTINLLGYPEQTIKVVYFVALSVVFNSISQMFYSIFQAHERMEYQSLGNILNSVLLLGGALFLISQRFNVIAFAFLYFLASLVVLAYNFSLSTWKFVKFRMEIDWNFWKSTVREALPFGLTSVFVTIYFYIDSVMLSLMKGDEAVGWYSAAYKIIFVLLFIPFAYFSSVYPITSRFYRTSDEALRFSFERSCKYMAIVGIPLGVGITLLASKIILLVFGSNYAPSIAALQILVWSLVLIFINSSFTNLFNSANKQSVVTKVMALSVALNIVLNFLLIPKYSYIGAGLATVASDFMTLLVMMVCILSTMKYKASIKQAKSLLKVLVSSLGMAVFIKYLERGNLVLVILVAALVYFGMLLSLKGFDEEDVLIIKKMLKPGDVVELN